MFLKKNFLFWILLLCCIPLFFINVKNSHEWGDDFAQYIHQAKNIAEGISQTETGYIFNERFAVLSPPAYMSGFPLLLAPVYYFFGLDFIAFSYFITFFFVLFFLLMFLFIKNYMQHWQAFILSFILIANPWMLNFKTEIVSDVPFACFLLLAFVVYLNAGKNIATAIVLGLIAGYLISIRMVGISFIIATALNELRLAVSQKNMFKNKQLLQFGILVPVIAIGFHYTLNYVLFDLKGNSASVPLSIFSMHKIFDTIIFNTYYYLQVYQDLFFGNWENTFAFAPTLLKNFFLCFTLLGFYYRAKNNFSINEIFCLVYMFVLLCYDYTGSGFRYLIPVLPFGFIYFTSALKLIVTHFNFNKKITVGSLLALVLLAYSYDWQKIYRNRNAIIEGPMRFSCIELMKNICETTKTTDRFMFIKPRAMALLTGRSFFSNHPNESPEIILQQIKEHNISYIITYTNIPNNGLQKFISAFPDYAEPVWNNNQFRLYRVSGK